MTELLTKLVIDCSTGETTEIPLTAEEIAQRETDAAAAAEEQELREAAETDAAALKASAQEKLIALGLTDAEIEALSRGFLR